MMYYNIALLIILMLFVMSVCYVFNDMIKTNNVIKDATKWTNMEITESVLYPNERMIVFWKGKTLTDMFYIDELGHPTNHEKR